MIKQIKFSLLLFFIICIFCSNKGWSLNEHSSHKPAIASNKTRTIVNYNVPDVTLINQNGKKINMGTLFNSDKIIALDFIFTTCPTICPILSAGFSSFQDKLGTKAESVQMVSITIDPENDTPELLKEYSERYNAQADWEFLTGTRQDINIVMKAFDAFVLNKMDHAPLTFLHAPGSMSWIRINGLLSSAEFIDEYKNLSNK